MTTAANLNFYRRWNSRVGWHCDDEPLFGECTEIKLLIVSASFGRRSPKGTASPVRTMKPTCAGLAMVTLLSWMVNVRTSFFIVRILVWNRNGLTLPFVGSESMLPPSSFWEQKRHVVSQRVRRVHQFLLRGLWEMVFFGRSGYSLVPLCTWEVLAWLVYSFVCTGLGSQRCASCWTRPLGAGRWRHYLCNI